VPCVQVGSDEPVAGGLGGAGEGVLLSLLPPQAIIEVAESNNKNLNDCFIKLPNLIGFVVLTNPLVQCLFQIHLQSQDFLLLLLLLVWFLLL
jgi:hypothetical protein